MLNLPFMLLLFSTALGQTGTCNLASGKELTEKQQEQFKRQLENGGDMAAIRFNMAIDYAKIGNQQKALATLEQALAETPWLDPAAEPDFKPLAVCERFRTLVERVEHKYPPRSAARVVFTIPQKDLIPEGLAVDPSDGNFYLSSIFHRKIVKISRKGEVRDFVSEGQDGLLGVLGMKVDPADRSVWAASERSGASALFHFDRNGHTVEKHVPQEPGKHLFNDLVITPSHDVFVTDSEDSSVYKLPHGSDKLVRIDLGGDNYPNGIALSSDGARLYVAHAFGIAVMDLKTGKLTELAAPRGISIAQADGLYYWQGSLIAIQNGLGPNRIVQLRLDNAGKVVVAGRLLEFRSTTLELPTTGAIYQGKFYYIVNSQIDHEEDGKLKDADQLKPVKIAALPLGR
ncbi:MAG TPA: SMP-30/gluconolactonase/LRE family protein [Terriglobales bacterium]|nr:SMP-30/gluconolactonase/LRE family protein [Terriglobales bacterium]